MFENISFGPSLSSVHFSFQVVHVIQPYQFHDSSPFRLFVPSLLRLDLQFLKLFHFHFQSYLVGFRYHNLQL